MAASQSKLNSKDEIAVLRAAVHLERLASVVDAAQLDGRLTQGDQLRREARELRRICRVADSATVKHD